MLLPLLDLPLHYGFVSEPTEIYLPYDLPFALGLTTHASEFSHGDEQTQHPTMRLEQLKESIPRL